MGTHMCYTEQNSGDVNGYKSCWWKWNVLFFSIHIYIYIYCHLYFREQVTPKLGFGSVKCKIYASDLNGFKYILLNLAYEDPKYLTH